MPKRTLFCVLGLLAMAVGGFLLIPLALPPRVTPENNQKIREGMRLADLEAILGPPQMRQFRVAWHYDMRTVERLHADFSPEREVAEAIRWQDRGGMIIVGFIASGEVAFKLFDPVPECVPAMIHRVARLHAVMAIDLRQNLGQDEDAPSEVSLAFRSFF